MAGSSAEDLESEEPKPEDEDDLAPMMQNQQQQQAATEPCSNIDEQNAEKKTEEAWAQMVPVEQMGIQNYIQTMPSNDDSVQVLCRLGHQ